MKLNFLLAIVFLSVIAFAYSGLYEHPTELLGGTELNGSGCVCHTVVRDTSVKVWIEGPDTLLVGQTGIYHMYLARGPAQAGGYNVAGRFGTMVLTDSFSFWDYRSPNELTQSFPLVFPSPFDTIYWEFGYTASDSSTTDTIYSCGLSIVFDGIPDSLDRWNFGPKFPITILQGTIPVEFVSFTAEQIDNVVELKWTTASELNNKGFEIQRSKLSEDKKQNWKTIGFIEGKGTTTEINSYSFIDNEVESGKYYYRLKQIDFNGSYEYSKEVEVEVSQLNKFYLSQNYPNPFNPVTKIRYTIPRSTEYYSVLHNVTLRIYDVLGNEVATLVNKEKSAGEYEIEFDASGINSGIYFYNLTVGNFTQTRKMIYLK